MEHTATPTVFHAFDWTLNIAKCKGPAVYFLFQHHSTIEVCKFPGWHISREPMYETRCALFHSPQSKCLYSYSWLFIFTKFTHFRKMIFTFTSAKFEQVLKTHQIDLFWVIFG